MNLLESRDQCNNYQRDRYDVIIIKSEFKQEMTQFEGHPVKTFGQRNGFPQLFCLEGGGVSGERQCVGERRGQKMGVSG